MNRSWSDQNKHMQQLLKKQTFAEGIHALIVLRGDLMQEILSWRGCTKEALCAIPYLKADGYHSKTAAYSLWHIFRIEDIVVNSLIRRDTEVLFSGSWLQELRSPIITTGNELKGMQIAEFSRQLNMDALFRYCQAVAASTDAWLGTLDYATAKTTFCEADKEALRQLQVVSADEDAAWLIDYWCGKDILGLMKMPLSRHWIMHIEAGRRILAKAAPGWDSQ